MGMFHNVLNPDEYDLTPDGDMGAPPAGPDRAPELVGERTDDDPRALDEILWPNADAIDLTPRIETIRNPDLADTRRPVNTRVLRNIVTLAPGGQPVPLFVADPNRCELILRAVDPTDPVWTAASNGAVNSITAVSGEVTGPPISTVLAGMTLSAGLYDIDWTVVLSGTPGAADINNCILWVNSSASAATSLNAGAADTYVQQRVRRTLNTGNNNLQLNTAGNASAGAVYSVGLTATPVLLQPQTLPWVWGAEKADCLYAASTAQYQYSTDGPLRLTQHTGAVWVSVPSSARRTVRIQGWSITK